MSGWGDLDLESLTAEQRAELRHRLAALDPPVAAPPAAARVRAGVLLLLVVCCVALIPWIVLLAVTLPRHYVASDWPVAWVGFDVALLSGLGATAWAIAARRQVAVPCAVITATLLCTDAWFDVLTSAGTADRLTALASALLVELPLAVALFAVARRLVVVTVARARAGSGSPPRLSLYRVPLFLEFD